MTCAYILLYVILYNIYAYVIYVKYFIVFQRYFMYVCCFVISSSKNDIACQHPILDPFDPEMMSFMKDEPPLVCDENEDWVTIKGNIARITDKALKKYGDIQCKFMGGYITIYII